MKKYLNEITHGDARELIKCLPNNSVDLIVTDPPYGVGGGIENNSEHILSTMLPEILVFVMLVDEVDCNFDSKALWNLRHIEHFLRCSPAQMNLPIHF